MNARLAIEENERFIRHLFTDVKEFSERKSKSLVESLNFIVDLKIKHCKSDAERVAWHLRRESLEKILNQSRLLTI
jgi:hypothetical protein